VKRLAGLALGVAVAAAGCGGAKPLVSPEEVDQPGAPLGARVEPAVKLPPVPKKDQDLLRFDVAPRTGLEYFVDPASISLPGEDIVRFTVVARSASAANVSYEGFRCITRQYKVYARTNRDGAWVAAKDPGWVPVGPRETGGFRHELYWNYFCPGKRIIGSAREGVDALRLGGHRDARPDGSMTGGM
jgi:hypothetical protein